MPCTILNVFFLFFHVKSSWFCVTKNFSNFFCWLLLFIVCLIHHVYGVPNGISKFLYSSNLGKSICDLASHVQHFFRSIFCSCFQMFSSSFIISGFGILSETVFFDSDFLARYSKDFNAELIFHHTSQLFLFVFPIHSQVENK